MLVNLNIKDKKILIIGSGNMAVQKAKQYLKEQAIVIILSKQENEAIAALPVVFLKKPYAKTCLEGYFLVHATTNDPLLNEQIVKDCTDMHIHCLSVTSSLCDMHSVLNFEDEHLQCAIGTKGSYPALNRILLHRIKDIYEAEYMPKMDVLMNLRKLLLQKSCQKEMIQELLRSLPNQPMSFLSFLFDALKYGRADILVFHGVQRIATINQEILPFLKEVRTRTQTPCYFAYVSDLLLAKLNETTTNAYILQELLSLLQLCGIKVTLHPMLMQKGRYHQQIIQTMDFHNIMPLPFSDLQEVQELIDQIDACYHPKHSSLLILYHSSEQGAFAKLIKQLRIPQDTILCSEKKLEELDTSQFLPEVSVYSLLMLSGHHMEEDGKRMIEHLNQHKVTLIGQSCLCDPAIKTILLSKF